MGQRKIPTVLPRAMTLANSSSGAELSLALQPYSFTLVRAVGRVDHL